ncbi:MAG: hypothetical protein ACI84K_001381 [Pseudohongiellaceae bacterium]|jgi:hypothetical protein
MTIDLSSLPTSIDIIHLVLASFTLILFILLIKKSKQVVPIEVKAAAPEIKKTPTVEKVATAQPLKLKENSPDAALQLLTLLQQDARFIDFIKEDLSTYSDADIGAAARVVHEGSKKTLDTYFTLEPVRNEDEETRISLPKGFNASEVRLTGNVVGEAPFNGTLIHKGWKVSETKLPKIAEGHDTTIVAPAEVEL